MRSTVSKIAPWAVVYHIWVQRNAIVHLGQVKTEEQIIKSIRKDVKARIENKNSNCNSILNRVLCCNWGINISILQQKATTHC
jgi:hypothetical protein